MSHDGEPVGSGALPPLHATISGSSNVVPDSLGANVPNAGGGRRSGMRTNSAPEASVIMRVLQKKQSTACAAHSAASATVPSPPLGGPGDNDESSGVPQHPSSSNGISNNNNRNNNNNSVMGNVPRLSLAHPAAAVSPETLSASAQSQPSLSDRGKQGGSSNNSNRNIGGDDSGITVDEVPEIAWSAVSTTVMTRPEEEVVPHTVTAECPMALTSTMNSSDGTLVTTPLCGSPSKRRAAVAVAAAQGGDTGGAVLSCSVGDYTPPSTSGPNVNNNNNNIPRGSVTMVEHMNVHAASSTTAPSTVCRSMLVPTPPPTVPPHARISCDRRGGVTTAMDLAACSVLRMSTTSMRSDNSFNGSTTQHDTASAVIGVRNSRRKRHSSMSSSRTTRASPPISSVGSGQLRHGGSDRTRNRSASSPGSSNCGSEIRQGDDEEEDGTDDGDDDDDDDGGDEEQVSLSSTDSSIVPHPLDDEIRRLAPRANNQLPMEAIVCARVYQQYRRDQRFQTMRTLNTAFHILQIMVSAGMLLVCIMGGARESWLEAVVGDSGINYTSDGILAHSISLLVPLYYFIFFYLLRWGLYSSWWGNCCVGGGSSSPEDEKLLRSDADESMFEMSSVARSGLDATTDKGEKSFRTQEEVTIPNTSSSHSASNKPLLPLVGSSSGKTETTSTTRDAMQTLSESCKINNNNNNSKLAVNTVAHDGPLSSHSSVPTAAWFATRRSNNNGGGGDDLTPSGRENNPLLSSSCGGGRPDSGSIRRVAGPAISWGEDIHASMQQRDPAVRSTTSMGTVDNDNNNNININNNNASNSNINNNSQRETSTDHLLNASRNLHPSCDAASSHPFLASSVGDAGGDRYGDYDDDDDDGGLCCCTRELFMEPFQPNECLYCISPSVLCCFNGNDSSVKYPWHVLFSWLRGGYFLLCIATLALMLSLNFAILVNLALTHPDMERWKDIIIHNETACYEIQSVALCSGWEKLCNVKEFLSEADAWRAGCPYCPHIQRIIMTATQTCLETFTDTKRFVIIFYEVSFALNTVMILINFTIMCVTVCIGAWD